MSLARDESKRLLKELQETAAQIAFERGSQSTLRQIVNKRTHRIRFADETEDQVTIIIEPKVESSE